MVGMGKGAQAGILFKNSDALQRAGAVGVVVLDKTGTITRGRPEVTDVVLRLVAAGWLTRRSVDHRRCADRNRDTA